MCALIEGGIGLLWGIFLIESASGDTHCHPSDFLRDAGRFVAEKHQGKQMQRLIWKHHSSLSFSAGCLLDYLKTEEGSQLNLPKLIDMSAQVSEQPLETNSRPRFVVVSVKFLRV